MLVRQGRVHTNPALLSRVVMETDTMKHMRVSLAAAALAFVFAGPLAFAKTPEPAPAGNTTPTPAAPASSEPSDASKVEKWTKKEWNNALFHSFLVHFSTLLASEGSDEAGAAGVGVVFPAGAGSGVFAKASGPAKTKASAAAARETRICFIVSVSMTTRDNNAGLV